MICENSYKKLIIHSIHSKFKNHKRINFESIQKLCHTSPMISCEVNIDIHNHRFSFTYFDQDGTKSSNFVDFNLLKQNELDVSLKKKNDFFFNLGFWKGKMK